jgi:SHAQKYF class myb-like DNA-binding protein
MVSSLAATQDGHWTNEEHEVFLELYDKFGRSWKKIAETMKTRSNEQVRTHAQKYFSKLEELR